MWVRNAHVCHRITIPYKRGVSIPTETWVREPGMDIRPQGLDRAKGGSYSM